jgi:hypothetical protein
MLSVVSAFWLAGCGGEGQDHPAVYQYDAKKTNEADVNPCTTANEGCPCKTPGEILDCGKIVIKVDNYESCYDGSRLCGDDGVWGACVADQEIVQITR